ncbi:Dipeptide transport ATP-binding protein DppD [Geodia barretti]|uniref:Dipeptide transport ATP-binding protein DppD n=1 Tax=Geodia barretti TaxID=519541 RepID=A0AA35R9W4_GEOBA|nr:Dipeptide transport ATP-binding protein DppD [Geodia barretti]
MTTETTAPTTDNVQSKATAKDAILSVRGLETHFFTDEGVVRAVDGVDFDIQPGSTMGIVGESGCGKSITAKSILQIVEAPGRIINGEINYNPRPAASSNSAEMRSIRGGEISMIFQEPMTSFSTMHTFGNQIDETLRLHTNLSKAERFDLAVDWLARVGIPNPVQRMHEYPFRFSGGQLQRAMIAMAMCTNPRVLIADEPTTALDVTTQAQILDLLQRMQEENDMAILFITHDLGVISEIADDVTVMYLGKVVESGPVFSFFDEPKHPYSKALLTSIPSMFTSSRERLPSISGSIPHPQDRPTGCYFHPRCPFATDQCKVEVPPLVKSKDGRYVSCHRADEIELTTN